jgi:hypothetical protein
MKIVVAPNNLPKTNNSKKITDQLKENIKQLINKYQFDEQSKYLAELLSLPRTTLANKVSQSLAKNNLKEAILIIEALYLTAITKEELKENSKLYKKLSLNFHPDKTKYDNEELKEQKSEFFKTFTPLLSANTSNEHLNGIIKSIHEKRAEIIEHINNPSALTYAGHFFCSTALPPIGQAIGTILCHKTFAQIMPRSEGENILRDICVTKTRETALEIETKLVKIPHHP